jgi:predicted nucleotidyltransferase
LARNGAFNEHSDIDLALEGLPVATNFWSLYADALALVEPFNLDLVLLESASPELQRKIRQEGVEI